jgi:hypothetical protein
MNQQNFDNFKKIALILLSVELKKYQDGEIKWNVGNQFNETVLETAIERFKRDESVQYQCYALFNATPPTTIIDLAYMASDFEVEPLAAGWTQ